MTPSVDEIFKNFNDTKVLVIGDVMLDTYLLGSADRISPEAPVPVVHVKDNESRLGGAANVALNLQTLGAKPILASVIGQDPEGEQLKTLLEAQNMSAEYLYRSRERRTTEKCRVISKGHQLLRFDREMQNDLSDDEEKGLMQLIDQALEDHKIEVVIFQDYNKGVLTPSLIEALISKFVDEGIPIAVDPKKKNFFAYKYVTLFKPNLKEVNEALSIENNGDELKTLSEVAAQLNKQLEHQLTLITLSEKGVFISDHQASEIIPATVRNVSDVSGAGDTVISVAALCLAQKLDKKVLARLANTAGGLACETAGVSPIDKEAFQQVASLLWKS